MNITDLQPQEVFHFFNEICKIPRPSKKEGRIIAFLKDFAEKHHLQYDTDAAGNVLIKEPICSKCYPGNMLDLTAYEDFITENNITQGIIVGDKGFPSSGAKSAFMNNKNLHFINPLKRDAKIIKDLKLYEYSGTLSNNEYILYKKEFDKEGNKWLYSFKDLSLFAVEEKDYLHRVNKNNKFSAEKYARTARPCTY